MIPVYFGLLFLLGLVVAIVLFIIVLVRRIEDKDKETFEKRDN